MCRLDVAGAPFQLVKCTPPFNGENVNGSLKINPSLQAVVYPNPTKDVATLEFITTEDELSLTIVNNMGQIVSQRMVQPQEGLNRINLDATTLPKGVYHIHLRGKTEYDIHSLMVN